MSRRWDWRSMPVRTSLLPIAEHGSWNRPQLNGYKVIFVPFADGRPNGPALDVATGFLNSDEKSRGRPVGLAVDKSGDLLIADDIGNTVWRVSSAGH
jgi:glucose/arabinose dehydrogenase